MPRKWNNSRVELDQIALVESPRCVLFETLSSFVSLVLGFFVSNIFFWIFHFDPGNFAEIHIHHIHTGLWRIYSYYYTISQGWGDFVTCHEFVIILVVFFSPFEQNGNEIFFINLRQMYVVFFFLPSFWISNTCVCT